MQVRCLYKNTTEAFHFYINLVSHLPFKTFAVLRKVFLSKPNFGITGKSQKNLRCMRCIKPKSMEESYSRAHQYMETVLFSPELPKN